MAIGWLLATNKSTLWPKLIVLRQTSDYPGNLEWWIWWGEWDRNGIKLVFFFFPFIFISWRLITLQYCSGFCHTLTWISHGFTCVPPSWTPLPPPSLPDPSGSSQCTSPEHLSHASNLSWWSVSPLIVYLFQCYSLRISHPCLLPQSPKVRNIF